MSHGNPHSGQKGGGVVVLARQPGVAHLLPNESLQEVRNRVIHTMIATGVGRMFVHFFAVYAPSGNTAAASRERLLQTVLFEAQAMVGQAPAVVMGDFNTDVERSPALRHALSNGWTDAAQLQAACEGGRPPNTYTGTNTSGTRIDYALMNRAAASAFVACETIGVGSVRGHRCVRIRLAVQAFEQQTWRFNVPRAIPVKPAGRVVEVPRLDAVCAAAREGDVEGAWMALSAMCEQYLLDRSGMPACERRAHTGRGNSELKMTRVAARSTPDRGVACETELRHGNAIRRLEHYVYQRARLEASGPFQVPQELRLCWLRCLAVIRGGGVGEPPPSDPPSAEVARVYLHDVRLRSARFNAAAARVRKRQQQERQLTMFGTDRRALVSMLRGGPGQAADAVRTADGRLTANVEEMDEVLQEAWDPILRMYGEGRPEPEYEAFRRAFEGFIPRRQMDLRDVTGRELRDVLNKRKKKTTACGVDGWRLDELKALPDELLDGFATLFNLVEERGEWPKGMLTSLVSLIPKTDDTSPTNLRPITVTSCVYRLWACRRLQDVMEWQDGWILPSQHGFRRGHRTDDVLMELTTLIEETLLDESKCFDRVPQGIVLRLAEEMGLDARILRPLRAMYRGMKRRFKLPLGVGSEFEVTNGILQGCPLSVILINALLSIVLRAVSARVPEVSSESLADDATLFASVESELQQAVDVIAQFCALTGMRLNMTKTLAMGIPAGTVRQRRRRPYTSVLAVGDETIPTATAAKILGVRTSVASVQAERTNDARLKAHNALLDRLSTSRLPFDVRCEVASSNVLGSVLAGCSYEGYTQTCLRGLRSRVVKGAFGTKHPSRNVTAVLAILAKAHRMDPLLARPYRILCSLFDTCERLPRVHARMLNIARLYSRHGVLLPKARLGPVGIAISDGFTVAGIDFEGHDFATAALEGRRLLDMERGERHHAIRARLRQTTWTQLARQRPSYDGVQAGVDCRRTNELRLATADAGEKRALAVILSGGVFLAARWGRNARANGGAAGTDGSPSSSASVSSTASDTTGSFDEHVSESSSSEPQRPPLDRGCRDCDLGVQDTADHLWWECPAYDEIRGRPCFAELLRADRARWPSCTRVHGVIVEGMRVEVAALHRLMAAVYTARVEAERRRLSAVQPMHPWHAAAPLPAVQHLFDFDRLPDEPPRWPYGGRAMRALKGWLSALRWTNAGEVSCVELAVDFEVHTGVDVPAPPGIRRLAANQRGKTLWTMLSTLCRLCRDLQLPSPLPAEGVVLAATAAVATGVAVVMAAAAVAAAAAAGAAETTVAETVAAAAALVAAAHAAAHAVAVAAAAAVAVAARATASQAGSGARRPHRGHLPAVAGEGGRRNRPRSAPPRQQAGSDPRLAPPRPLPQPRCAHDDDAPISATTALASPARTHRAHPAPPGPLRWQALTRALFLILVPTLHGSHNDRALPPALPGYSPDHLWWECPAYDEIRGRPCFAELLRADRARWPSCTRVHGVIVEGMRVEVAALHRLMAAVYTARVEAERRRLSAVQPMHPWHAAAPLPAVQHLFDFDRLPDEPPRWPYGGRAMRALKGWLSALRWTNAGEVSCVELAVDFEVHTGVDVPAPPGIRRLAANQRGKTLWTMLSTLCRLCQDLQLPSPLPAERKVRVGSMRTLGAPMLWGGLTPRPRFAGGEETHGVLGTSFPRAAAGDGKNWGGDVFPQYDAARRAQRSLRWDVPTPLPQRPRLPVLVPAAQADPLLRTQSVCDACAKQKCAVCTGMRRNYSLVVDQCCQVHHRPDDGVVLAATAAVATGVAVVMAAAAVAAAAAAEAAETTVTETVAAAAALVAAAHAAAVAAAVAAGIAAAAAVAVAA
ncbi:Retrovirus-related Pol polyprotein from type-1 retrotransposable element R2 [Diplonema papillatum]|nr:Retrovirus-related Pol polyprotein from type-1 retrotransposable element R2 [Diplonema papillatum]